jgi:hypothetical protein
VVVVRLREGVFEKCLAGVLRKNDIVINFSFFGSKISFNSRAYTK